MLVRNWRLWELLILLFLKRSKLLWYATLYMRVCTHIVVGTSDCSSSWICKSLFHSSFPTRSPASAILLGDTPPTFRLQSSWWKPPWSIHDRSSLPSRCLGNERQRTRHGKNPH